MTEELESWPEELAEILKKEGQERMQELSGFAKKVGASRSHWARMGGDNNATEAQLVDNIQRAMQTTSMVEMCKTANRNFIIALIATVIALVSAAAVWVAVLTR